MAYKIDSSKCVGCGACAAVCQMFNAAKPDGNGKFTIDPALCQECGACLNACPMEAVSKL